MRLNSLSVNLATPFDVLDRPAPDVEASGAAEVLSALANNAPAQAREQLDKLATDHALRRPLEILIDGCQVLMDGDYETGLRRLLPQIGILERAGLERALPWLYSGIGFALGACGDPERGLEWTTRALVASEGQGGHVRVKVLSNHGCLLGMLEQTDASLAALEQAAQVGAESGLVRSQALTLSNLGYACLSECWRLQELGDAAAAFAYAERAMAYSNSMADTATTPDMDFPLVKNKVNLGLAMVALNRASEALDVLESVRDGARAWAAVEVDRQLGCAQALLRLGHFDDALARLADCRRLAETHSLELALPRVFLEQVELAKAAGDTATALRHAESHVHFLRQHYPPRLRAIARSAAIFAEAQRLREEAETLREQSKEWEEAALRDTLTGTYNRRGLSRRAQPLLEQGGSLAVAAFDADHFKQVNDRFGHAIGDDVLKALAATIGAHTRDGDVLARIGGEEFVLLLPGLTGNTASATCERIRQAIENYAWVQLEPSLKVTTSIGIAVRTGETTLEPILAQADQALYEAKHSGRNRVVLTSLAPPAV